MKRIAWLTVVLGLCMVAIRVGANVRARTVVARAGELHPTISARAVVVPAAGTAHVLAPAAGRAERIVAREGDRVHAGDLLAVVRTASTDERIVSPIDGIVLARHVDAGDTVGAAPTPLFEIADLERLELRLEIDERDASDVAVGTTVHWQGASARVDRLAPEITRREDALDDVAARATTRVRLAWAPLPEATAALLGEHGLATLDAPARSAAVVVPRDAIVLRDGHATLRVRRGVRIDDLRVKLGAFDADQIAVEGVSPGAELVMP